MGKLKQHLVVSVGGGPLSFLYGAPKVKPRGFIAEIKAVYRKSNAVSLGFICVDPNTEVPYTSDLDPYEKGFKFPDFNGSGWNAKLYDTSEFEGKAIAALHEYCGSGSTNLNEGKWQKNTCHDYIKNTIAAINEVFPELVVVVKKYFKSKRDGMVDKRLQRLTKTPFAIS